MCVLITCEVGGNQVPIELVSQAAVSRADQKRKRDSTELPPSNPDSAALYVAQRMAEKLSLPLIANEYSTQWIDVSRSLHHPRLFSKFSRKLPDEIRQGLIDKVYLPYRDRVQQAIDKLLNQYHDAIHLSVRSFAAKHKGKYRRTDIGLQYDPAVEVEADFCIDWIDELYDSAPMLKVRRNYPRRGTVDSLTRAMRQQFQGQEYLGIEVQLNRAWAARAVPLRDEAIDGFCEGLRILLSLEDHRDAA